MMRINALLISNETAPLGEILKRHDAQVNRPGLYSSFNLPFHACR
jgi:hypothetical protein